jgi:GDPmannose 4,6-dehydratase
MSKKVIITGVTGMDGSHMADYLLNNTDNTVVAGIRRLSNTNHKNIDHLKDNPRFKLIDLDITDSNNVEEVIRNEQPDYFINFAANSFVGNSWTMPVNHMQTNCMAVLYQLEAIRKFAPNCRYYQAGSSEEFGDVAYCPQDEKHPLKPRSPYGASKVAARMLVKVYRESYKLYAIQGWLFNHEGIRRGPEFVTRKITINVARIRNAIKASSPFESLELGNIDAKRDWSDSEDFVEGIWKMLNQEMHNKNFPIIIGGLSEEQERIYNYSKNIKEYVLSSNETHTVREFVEKAFKYAGIEGSWTGEGINEKYVLKNNPEVILMQINPKFYRPAEVDILLGDSQLARKELNWSPKTSFEELVKKMVENDLKNQI